MGIRAAVTLAIGAGAMFAPMHSAPVRYGLLAITLAILIWAGREIFAGAWRAARHGSADMNALVALGTSAAFLYSAVGTIAPNCSQTRTSS